jgi:hypothetical protein
MQTSGDLRRENADAHLVFENESESLHVIARSEATKQSMFPLCRAMDCFASLAMTVDGIHRAEEECYPSLNSSYPFAATSSHLARYAGALPL